jgi:hypothetical protein
VIVLRGSNEDGNTGATAYMGIPVKVNANSGGKQQLLSPGGMAFGLERILQLPITADKC